MSAVSWRDAGFPDDEGRAVRNWVARKIDAAEAAIARKLDQHPTGLENPAPAPGAYERVDDPELVRLFAERKTWQGLLEGIDQGGAPGFMRAHGAWTRAGGK